MSTRERVPEINEHQQLEDLAMADTPAAPGLRAPLQRPSRRYSLDLFVGHVQQAHPELTPAEVRSRALALRRALDNGDRAQRRRDQKYREKMIFCSDDECFT